MFEFLTVEAGLPPVLSSQPFAWEGLIAQQRHHLPRTLSVPPLSNHLITIYNGSPCEIIQKRDGQTRKSIRTAGNISIVPVGSESYWSMAGETRVLNLDFTPEFVKKVALQCDLNPDCIEIINHFDVHDPFLQQMGSLLKIELETEGMGGRLMAESLGTAIVVHLLRHYSASMPQVVTKSGRLSPADLQTALDYIQAHLDQELSLSTLASVVNLSQFHFVRLFKQSTGLTPHQYVIRARVKAAVRLLRDSTLSVGEVAAHVGFAHQSHLANHMRRLLGVSPKAILKSARTCSN